MTTTYYESLNEAGQPATLRMCKAYGTTSYGYRTRVMAEAFCPPGGLVAERHTDGTDDWGGRVVSIRTVEGRLERLVQP